MAQITCPTCNPSGATGLAGAVIPGPGIVRKFGTQATLCPQCKGTGYVDSGTQIPIPGTPIQGAADTSDAGNPNNTAAAIPLLVGP